MSECFIYVLISTLCDFCKQKSRRSKRLPEFVQSLLHVFFLQIPLLNIEQNRNFECSNIRMFLNHSKYRVLCIKNFGPKYMRSRGQKWDNQIHESVHNTGKRHASAPLASHLLIFGGGRLLDVLHGHDPDAFVSADGVCLCAPYLSTQRLTSNRANKSEKLWTWQDTLRKLTAPVFLQSMSDVHRQPEVYCDT